MRVFEITINGEKYWVAAYTLLTALKELDGIGELILQQVDRNDTIEELTVEKWDSVTIKDVDTGENKTINQLTENRVHPFVIGGTSYDI